MTGMLRTELDALYDDILRSRRLLAHPFYRRWEAGTLEPGELAGYAGQYRHFEAVLPVVLERVAAALPEGRARRFVQANLDDERGVPAPHLELFETFAAAVGAPAAAVTPATPATTGLIELYLSLADRPRSPPCRPWPPTRSKLRPSPPARRPGSGSGTTSTTTECASGTSMPGSTSCTVPGCSTPWAR